MSWRFLYVSGSLSVKKNNSEYINKLRLKQQDGEVFYTFNRLELKDYYCITYSYFIKFD
jgi:hypothetical protein